MAESLTAAEGDGSDALEAMVNALNDSLSQPSDSPRVLDEPTVNPAASAFGAMAHTSVVAGGTLPSALLAAQSVLSNLQTTTGSATLPAATSVSMPSAFATASAAAGTPTATTASPFVTQQMPVQMMMINGRQQPAVIMTVPQAHAWQRQQLMRAEQLSHGANPQLAAQMEQQQQHMQQLLASAKPETVFAIPMAAATAGSAAPTAALPSTAASSVSTAMTSVGDGRSTADPASSSSSFSSLGSPGFALGATGIPPTGLSSAALAAAAQATAAAAAAAVQATAVAVAAAGGGKRPSIDSPTESAAKRKKKKAAVEALPKPLTPYQCFFREIQTEIRKQNPKASFAELSKTVSTMWEGMPPDSQLVYNVQAQQSAVEYEQSVKAIQGMSPTQANGAPASQFYPAEDTKGPSPRSRTKKAAATKCLNEECMNMPVASPARGSRYCSDACAVTHCQIAFKNWVADRRKIP